MIRPRSCCLCVNFRTKEKGLILKLAHFCRAVTAYLNMVRRWKPSSAEVTRGGEHERGIVPSLVRGVWGLPLDFF